LFKKFLKKNDAIIYKNKAPIEIDKTEIRVPVHFPNKMPDIIKSGDPNPSSVTHVKQNAKNIRRFK
jgi:hypothetical protein